jgi:hypothetical protein
VLVRLLPELSERGITELMEERGVFSWREFNEYM